MPEDFTPPAEVLAFLVRTLPPRVVWEWLSQDEQLALRGRITRGFRAAAETLRQPAARTRLVSHLEKNLADFKVLLAFWADSAPPILPEIRALADEALASKLSELEQKHGAESLLLALLHEEKDDALEAWTNADDEAPIEVAQSTPADESDEDLPRDNSAELEKTKKLLTRETQKAEHWRAKFKDASTRAAQTERALRDKLNEQENLARKATRQSKADSLRAESSEAKQLESDKSRERAERRARTTQAELEAAQNEVKTLRKQLQRLQQMNEELRGRLAASLEKRDDGRTERREDGERFENGTPNAAADNKKSSHLPNFPSSRSKQNEKPDAQKIVAAINRNDETFVANLRYGLSALQKHDAAAHKKLMQELRAAGKFYERVLRTQTARVLVDASNVARYDATPKGKIRYLLAMREELRRHDFFPILFVADASLPYFIDDAKCLRQMIACGEVLTTASGQQADEVLARQAKETGAYVVTNDRNFHFAFAPNFAPSRIGFRITDGVILLEDF
jgi:hypothetical protein